MPKHIGNLTLYSVEDLHKQLGLSKMTIRAYLREGKIKGRKLGVKWYVTEEALRSYFHEPPASPSTHSIKKSTNFCYLVQGQNDLVSEQQECDSIEDTLVCIKNQAIISLFQVAIIDKATGDVVEKVQARDFIDRYA